MESEEPYTFEEYFRGFLNQYLKDEEEAARLAQQTVEQWSYRKDKQITGDFRDYLNERFIEPKTTILQVVYDEMVSAVDEAFADKLSKMYSIGFTVESRYSIDHHEEEIPRIIGRFIRNDIEDQFNKGEFDDYVDAYMKGKLDDFI